MRWHSQKAGLLLEQGMKALGTKRVQEKCMNHNGHATCPTELVTLTTNTSSSTLAYLRSGFSSDSERGKCTHLPRHAHCHYGSWSTSSTYMVTRACSRCSVCGLPADKKMLYTGLVFPLWRNLQSYTGSLLQGMPVKPNLYFQAAMLRSHRAHFPTGPCDAISLTFRHRASCI